MKKKYLNIMLFLLLTIFYFEYSVTITWDSAHYLEYVKILEKIVPFSSWDVVRGPIFPLIIYFSNLLFSKSNHGLLVLTYLYYLLMLLFAYKIVDAFFDKFHISIKFDNVIKCSVIVLIIVNPIIYGYYHCLLTEFVAITLGVISCYFSVVWLDTDFYKERNKYILLSLLFIFLTLVSWFLKQPYVSCGFFALFVSYIISIFQYKNKKQFLIRSVTVLSCVVCLFIGIRMWNYVLDTNGNDTSTTRNPTNSLGNQLINAVGFLEVNNNKTIYDVDFINISKLNAKEKKEVLKLLDEDYKYVLIYKYNKNKKIYDVDYIRSNTGETVSTMSSLLYIMKIFFQHPIKLLHSYVINYFSIIDIYGTTTLDGVGYTSTKKFDINFSNEITSIGNKPYYNGSNLFSLSDNLYQNAVYYEEPNYTNKVFNYGMVGLSRIVLYIFKMLFFLLPIILVWSVVMRFLTKIKKNYFVFNMFIILFGFSFLHILLHTVTGAIIDRYALPAFIPTFIGFVLFLIFVISSYKTKKHKK